MQLTATLPGESGVQVRFTTRDSTPYVRTAFATTDADGVARAAIPVNFSGVATASVAGSDTQAGLSASVFYEVPARVRLVSSRPLMKSGTVNVYRSAAAIHLAVYSRPTCVNHVEALLYRRIAGKWVLRVDQSLTTNTLGAVNVTFPKLLKNQIYREVVFVGSTVNNAASPKTSFTFELK
jgi:hypothetical protein